MTIVQIETRQAVENFEEIIDTPNVDAWFVGPNDLAASLGHLGNPDAIVVQEAMDKILKIGIKHDVPGGTLAFSSKTARTYPRERVQTHSRGLRRPTPNKRCFLNALSLKTELASTG